MMIITTLIRRTDPITNKKQFKARFTVMMMMMIMLLLLMIIIVTTPIIFCIVYTLLSHWEFFTEQQSGATQP